MTDANPLLNLGFRMPFDQIRAEHVEPGIASLLQSAAGAVDAVAQQTGSLTYDSVMEALDAATEPLEIAITVVGHLESVASAPELRAAYTKVRPEVSTFYAGIPLNAALWKVLKAYSETPDAKALFGARRRYLEKTIDEFRRHGADLDEAGKTRLTEITRELSEITNKYSQNLLDATAAYEWIATDEQQLAGLPPSAIEAARENAKSKEVDGYRFTLQAPSLIPVLTYLDDGAVREKMFRAYTTRASSGELDNRGLIARIIELRKEKAGLLGYGDFADLVLEPRMAKTGAAALQFVGDLTEKTEAGFKAETAALQEYRDGEEGEASRALSPWDVAYYAEKQRKALYDFDEEELRPYFPVNSVLTGLFETVNRLYGIEVRAADSMPGWHADVKTYDVLADDGAHIGSFYADLFPREEKRSGAWMNGLISGQFDGQQGEPHLGLICANLTPPIGDKSALLTHNEVTTIFHEFGHLLHHLLSRVEVRALAGTNVAWDFVELPSQIMENWCWEREALDLFARHHETDAPIPDALFEKMQRARTYRAASAMMRQLGFASTDLALHTKYDPATDGDVVAYARDIMLRYAPVAYPDDYAFVCGFGHLFSSAVGYAAGYYSYKWAEVLDADAFTAFKKGGVFSREVGAKFRDAVLSRGDGEDPMELYKAFMGREPDLDPLLERSGLPTSGANQ